MSMLRALWAEGGRGRQQHTYELTRVEAIIPEERQLFSFRNTIENFEAQRVSGHAAFNASFQDEKHAVLQKLKGRFASLPGLQRANLLLVLHGCNHAAADSICQTGFSSIATLDSGFIGRGNYVTTHAEYACKYATGVLATGFHNPANANAQGEYIVLAAWATPGLTYPITRSGEGADYISGSEFSRFYAAAGEPAKAIQPPYASHFMCVRYSDYQCMDGISPGAVPNYDELVLNDSSQLLPAYRVYFRPPSHGGQ